MKTLNPNKTYCIIDGKIYENPEIRIFSWGYAFRLLSIAFFACLIAFGIAYLAFKTITQTTNGEQNGHTTTSTNEKHNQSLREQD